MRRFVKLVTNRTSNVLCAYATLMLRLSTLRMDYIRFYHLRAYDRINAPLGESAWSRTWGLES